MDFLNQREGGFLSGLPPFSFTVYCTVTELYDTVRGCVSLKKYKYQGKAIELTVNSKEENSQDFCLDFVQEFGPRAVMSREAVSLRSPHIVRHVTGMVRIT